VSALKFFEEQHGLMPQRLERALYFVLYGTQRRHA